MNTRTMTLEQIRQTGLKALARELGPVGMIRFLQQFETGHGNYSEERHKWIDDLDVKTLAAEIDGRRRERQ